MTVHTSGVTGPGKGQAASLTGVGNGNIYFFVDLFEKTCYFYLELNNFARGAFAER